MAHYPYFINKQDKAYLKAKLRKETQQPIEQYLLYDIIPCPHTQLNGKVINRNEIIKCPDCNQKLEFTIINGITIGRVKQELH